MNARRRLALALLALAAVSLPSPAAAARPTVSWSASAELYADGVDVELPVTVTCRGEDRTVDVTLRQQRNGKPVTRATSAPVRCDGKPHTVRAGFPAPVESLTPPMTPGPARVTAGITDEPPPVSGWTTLRPAKPRDRGPRLRADLIGDGAALVVVTTVRCSPGEEIDAVATAKQRVSREWVQGGISQSDPYAGAPIIPCRRSPMTLRVPVLAPALPFVPGPVLAAIDITVWDAAFQDPRYVYRSGQVTARPLPLPPAPARSTPVQTEDRP